MIPRVMFAFFASLALAAQPSAAQSPGVLPMHASVVARLVDGSQLVGRITEQTVDSVEVTTASGRFMLARSAIRELRLLTATEIQEDRVWPADPHETGLFFAQTGRTLAAGTGYFTDTYLLLFGVGVGITDRVTLGVGMTAIPLPSFFLDNVYYVAPKIALVRSDSFNLAVGAMVGFSGHFSGPGWGRAYEYYISATRGAPDASFTYGLGYTNTSASLIVPGSPFLLLGGSKRTSRKLSLMTENYFILHDRRLGWAPLYGVRFIGERFSTDLGFVNYLTHDARLVFPGVPWLGFALKL